MKDGGGVETSLCLLSGSRVPPSPSPTLRTTRIGSSGVRGSGQLSTGEGSFPGKPAPSQSPHPKTTVLHCMPNPWGVRCCFLPYPTADQNHNQIKVSPVRPTSPQRLSHRAGTGRSMGSSTKEGLSVSLCPALGRPHSF